MAVLKALASGGTRRELDFYPTPPAATRALLPLIADWPDAVWEPCCGDGAIGKELETEGFKVVATDLIDRGYGVGNRDFFEFEEALASTIVTNPPFSRADNFIRHALDLGIQRMALLLKINFWNAAKRTALWDEWPPAALYPLTWRLDFTGAGAPHFDCMWCVWDGPSHLAICKPLRKPA